MSELSVISRTLYTTCMIIRTCMDSCYKGSCCTKHMPKYPNCNVMLIKYVQDKITPLLQVIQNNDKQDTWDERVQYFEGGREEPSGKEVNLVYFFELCC